MAYTTILYEADDRVAWMTLNRPSKRNALSIKLCNEFADALAIAERDSDVRVIVIKGAGDRSFSSGFDMAEDKSEFGPPERAEWTFDHLEKLLDHACEFLHSVFRCSKPVIAMINGHCLAGGLDLAMWCDMRYCSDDSRFGAIEVRFAAGDTELPIMSHVIGQRCRELVYTGDVIDAQEALRLGLVNRVFPKERLEEEVARIAKRISRVALPTLVWSKRALNNTLHAAGLESALRYSYASDMIISKSDSEYRRFRELLRTEGAKAASQWIESIFAPFESGASRASSNIASTQPTKAGD
ncbi:enoyl-CoA hydratase/isomerase family protein [Bradyrhizobium vignae]|uniref:enoyl-CoA hydratase/isomerase family protein n=1 Tax=Bradyrhizobium vignae TaxID=1549949 RepID=UPI00100B0251|nr:enoyl-CoA hydratase/isomerase family protein [Bradyrhizobium vignae]RXG97236.1 enoyl-CoA hydratase/isomerase family protein [Bradyrhizobium vignae]